MKFISLLIAVSYSHQMSHKQRSGELDTADIDQIMSKYESNEASLLQSDDSLQEEDGGNYQATLFAELSTPE